MSGPPTLRLTEKYTAPSQPPPTPRFAINQRSSPVRATERAYERPVRVLLRGEPLIESFVVTPHRHGFVFSLLQLLSYCRNDLAGASDRSKQVPITFMQDMQVEEWVNARRGHGWFGRNAGAGKRCDVDFFLHNE